MPPAVLTAQPSSDFFAASPGTMATLADIKVFAGTWSTAV